MKIGFNCIVAISYFKSKWDKSVDELHKKANFIPPKKYPSWTLNESTCRWEPPTAKPNDDNVYMWNEEDKTWDIVE